MTSAREPTPVRVLYIEDDRDLAALVKLRLEESGYNVDLAYDGEEGLFKCSAGSYDLVAVDHSVPLRDGLSVIRTLAGRGDLPPSIMITGQGDEKIAVETMKLGTDDYIVKDTLGGWLDLLPAVIDRVFEQRRRVQEKSRAEEELRESQKRLEEASRMAAVVAHEINSPLAGIKSCYTLIKDAIPTGHPDHRFVELIGAEITRIRAIVSQLYELHRPLQEPEQDVDVAELITDVLAILEAKCRDRRIRLERDGSLAHLPARIPINGVQQVLHNVVRNAIEASPPEEKVTIDACATDGRIQISISDGGPGIPDDIGNQVFSPFFTTKGGEGGLGLGLAISKRIMESYGGDLQFKGRPGTGTTFRITMPISPEGTPERSG